MIFTLSNHVTFSLLMIKTYCHTIKVDRLKLLDAKISNNLLRKINKLYKLKSTCLVINTNYVININYVIFLQIIILL